MEKKQTNKIRLITGTAMLTAVAVGLQYVEIAIPIMPSFIKLEICPNLSAHSLMVRLQVLLLHF